MGHARMEAGGMQLKETVPSVTIVICFKTDHGMCMLRFFIVPAKILEAQHAETFPIPVDARASPLDESDSDDDVVQEAMAEPVS
eukprot:365812-Chlamydomonas_euryale.AAC.12